MTTRLLNIWTKVRASFWFVPTLMILAAFALSFIMIAVDEATDSDITSDLGWIYTNKPEGAREVLSTIAGSMITVAGVVFSITIVALSLASSQFGPRLLSNFMRDTGSQVVLGTFISTYFYCLLILRTIRSGDETQFVPHFSVAVGVLLAICSLAVLIYFIHHVSESIQASSIISQVDTDYSQVIDRLFPEKIGKDAPPDEQPEPVTLDDSSCLPVFLMSAGFLQAIDQENLMKVSTFQNMVVKLLVRPGDYVVTGQKVAELYSNRRPESGTQAKTAKCFLLGKERTLEQDALFPVNQLVEISLRALSPSINDPFTAAACINRLTNGLCKLATRHIPSHLRKDDSGQLRVVAQPVSFAEVVNSSFEQIRYFGCTNPRFMLYVLQSQYKIAQCLQRQADKTAMLLEARHTLKAALEKAPEEEIKKQLRQEYARIERKLALPGTAPAEPESCNPLTDA